MKGAIVLYNTYVKPSSELRNKYPEISELVQANNQVIITNNGKAELVLIKMEDYKKYEEFLHWRYVDEKLAEAEQAAADPNAKWHTHEEVFARFREKYDYGV